ncbi:MAG: penicillin-binding transpeptidase domain-containing protein [Chloroflexota bacterium]|nr:penicillin-binding transpeptidase domain-containing protein [Chloroflexota bacterium]
MLLALTFTWAAVASACEAAPPAAEPVARAYASAWTTGDYPAMFASLTDESRARYGEDATTKRLPRIAEELTLRALDVQAGEATRAAGADGKPDPRHASVPLSIAFHTARVGDFRAQTNLSLVLVGEKDKAAWRIDWSPQAILPQLTSGRLVRVTRLPTSRGRILARDGSELATFVDASVVGVVPGQIKNEAAMLASLSSIVALKAEDIKAKYTQAWVRPESFVPVKTIFDLTADARAKLSVIEGAQLQPQRVRSYPTSLAAQTIGYVGEASEADAAKRADRGFMPGDTVGKTGLEATLDDVLGGSFGWRLGIVESDERPVETLAETQPVPGQDAVLALDPVMQRAAESALGDQRGAVVVEDPWSGEVQAIASRPSFDLGAFIRQDGGVAQIAADPRKPLFNRATFGRYPTGSSFKPITAAAALRQGLYHAGDRIDCPAVWTGYGPQWRQLNHETSDLGPIDLRTALARSCNSFFYELGKRLNDANPDLLPDEAKSFGLGKGTDIDYVFEDGGLVPSRAWKAQQFANDPAAAGWNPGDATNLAIGQGFLLVTPLQMANYAAALSNDGIVWKPRLVLELRDRAGTTTKTFPKAEAGHALSAATDLSLIRDGMRAVVTDPFGTVYFPFLGFAVPTAGKSGTAETTPGAPDAWFIGFAPFDRPALAIATILEEKPGLTGSQDTAKISRTVLAARFGTP